MIHDDLGDGLAGIALHEMVVARARGDWSAAHAAAQAVTALPLTGHPDEAGLYRGVPAVGYALRVAGHPAYARTLAELDDETAAIATARVDAGQRRMDRGRPARMAEYDLISGVTGLGVYLLRSGQDAALQQVLDYLVRLLTEPVTAAGHQVPGWWAADAPSGVLEDGPFGAGHANFGLAHGMAGPLALLALAGRAGHTVDGQQRALDEGIAFLVQWARPRDGGAVGWPDLLPLDTFLQGPVAGLPPSRPSWCYGTPGIGRALQLAALDRHDDLARETAEHAVLDSVTDPRQLDRLDEATVCHGWAGLLLTCDRVAADAMSDGIARRLPRLRARLGTHLARHATPKNVGLLTGSAGVLLTLHTLSAPRPVQPGWETCLLLN
ncbi:lanthionine synthetase C family protein [Streptomyces sp. NPDC097107]|uniref:lanthionine synthetase C family protein n=1 Tax=Streptomyces sp. NPDC097107 TaxID=3366089 RepID=UPI00382A001C